LHVNLFAPSVGASSAREWYEVMETDSLLMDSVPDGTTVSHRRSPRGILGRSGSRHTVRESSDEELLDVNLSLPYVAETDDRAHGTDVILVGIHHLHSIPYAVLKAMDEWQQFC